MLTLMLIWDYDTPTGFDASHNSRDAEPLSEYRCTDRILELFEVNDIVSTFACVGVAAEPGPLPYHNPQQIREIHALGHEVASHTQRHELIPTLNGGALRETLISSKRALEDCIGADVVGLVPPWNRPFHFPQRGAFSLKDWRAGGRRWRQSVDSLAAAMADCGYRWLRVLYGNPVEKRFWRDNVAPFRHEQRHGVDLLRLSTCGYDAAVTDWLDQPGQRDATVVLYGHPHAIEHDNAQHWRHLQHFVAWVAARRQQNSIALTTPARWLALDGKEALVGAAAE